MKLHTVLLSFLFFLSLGAWAQPQMRLSAMRYDFGSVIWKQPVEAVFQITNVGSSDLIIENVYPDCGCTHAEWTKTPIATGKTGQIKATFDAELLGRFHKQLAVRTNESAVPFYLTLSGDVVSEIKDYSKKYAYRIGDIYLDTDNIEFDNVERGDYPFRTITVFNGGRKTYQPQLMHLPPYLKVECNPVNVRPGAEGYINVILNSELLHKMGLTQTNIYLSRFPGDRISHENEILCSAILLPELNWSDKDVQKAPKIEIEATELDLGQFAGKSKLKGKIKITNTGNSNLEISALQVYNPGISASLGKRTIKPGASTTLKVALYADREHFKGRRRVLLITNDPQSPKLTIDIRAKK